MATLTLLIQESLVLDDNDRSNLYRKQITDVNYLDHRTVSIPSGSETVLFKFDNLPGAGTFVTSSLKYARVSNLSETVPVNIRVSSSLENFSFRVDAGGTFMINSSKVTGSFDSLNFEYDDIEYIAAEPSSSAAKVEYYIATS